MKNSNILDGNNIKNLMSMLDSPDLDNKHIALEAIKQLDLTNSVDFVLVLYNFSEIPYQTWETIPNVMKVLESYNIWSTKSSVECLKRLRDKEAFNLFCELESIKLQEQLKVWGYPIEFIDVEIKLKTNI